MFCWRLLNFTFPLFSGELPLELIQMKVKGATVNLFGNAYDFELPSNIGELGDDITMSNLSNCSLIGPLGILY